MLNMPFSKEPSSLYKVTEAWMDSSEKVEFNDPAKKKLHETVKSFDLKSEYSLATMGKLEILNLSENLLEQMAPIIIQLKNLKTINLSHNQLTHIPKELFQIAKLNSLDKA